MCCSPFDKFGSHVLRSESRLRQNVETEKFVTFFKLKEKPIWLFVSVELLNDQHKGIMLKTLMDDA